MSRPCTCDKCGAPGQTQEQVGAPVWCPTCLPTVLEPGQRVVTCRHCGAVGIEDKNDPVPGVCPRCLETQLQGEEQ